MLSVSILPGDSLQGSCLVWVPLDGSRSPEPVSRIFRDMPGQVGFEILTEPMHAERGYTPIAWPARRESGDTLTRCGTGLRQDGRRCPP